MLINAKEEFLDHVGTRPVDFVSISCIDKVIKGNIFDALKLLDFTYNNDYGGQHLQGYIWYTDGTWSERGEYDGSGWWEYKCCPDKNEYMKKEM